jgi:hypothetical protein
MALTAKPIYRWTIYLIRKRGELLGSVEAPDEKAAIKAAIENSPLPSAPSKSGLSLSGIEYGTISALSLMESRFDQERRWLAELDQLGPTALRVLLEAS